MATDVFQVAISNTIDFTVNVSIRLMSIQRLQWNMQQLNYFGEILLWNENENVRITPIEEYILCGRIFETRATNHFPG